MQGSCIPRIRTSLMRVCTDDIATRQTTTITYLLVPPMPNMHATISSKRPKKISAPKPSALPVLAFLIKEVLFRTAAPPVIIAAIAVGKTARIK